MKLKWLGHAAFLLTSDAGTRIVTDPYTAGGPLTYGDISETAEGVTMSHTHNDHNNKGAVKGKPVVVTSGPAKVKDINISGIPTFHDEANGTKRGSNVIFCFDIDDLRICHLGDLGHELNDKQVAELGKVDILMIPVGGYYTIDAAAATKVVNHINPRVVVPMHYKTGKCGYPIEGVEPFLKGKKNVRQVAGSEVEFKAGQLPVGTEIFVLQPAL